MTNNNWYTLAGKLWQEYYIGYLCCDKLSELSAVNRSAGVGLQAMSTSACTFLNACAVLGPIAVTLNKNNKSYDAQAKQGHY